MTIGTPADPPHRLRPLPDRVAPPGLDEAAIKTIVDAFYERVRTDPLIGPVFDARIEPGAWPHHLETMYAFWSALLLGTRRYDGRPMPKHLAIPNLSDAHFVRWLALFKQTVDTLCVPETAALFIDRAERIAQSFRLGIAIHRGESSLGIQPLRAGIDPIAPE